MEDDTEMVDLGGIKVPKAFKERWDELIGKNKELKNQLFEAKTSLQEKETATNPELETAKARILELEGVVAKSEHSRTLAADGVDGDEELYDYLQYQYGKVTPEEGKEKPSFGDWYKDAKTKSSVIKSAVEAAAASKTQASGDPKKPAAKVDPKAPETKSKVVATTTKTVPEKKPAASEVGMDADSISGMDPATFKANKAALRKQLFGS